MNVVIHVMFHMKLVFNPCFDGSVVDLYHAGVRLMTCNSLQNIYETVLS